MRYRITTDSTCDLPPSFYEERHIAYLGLSFTLEGVTYREDADCPMSAKQFYDALRGKSVASTAQVNAFDFENFARPFLEAGEDVLHIAFSSGLSGTYASCEQGAAELRAQFPDRQIVVVDSLCASTGEGLLVYYADENRKAGMSLSDNAAWLNDNRFHLAHWFTVDDLMFLHRGGRVSKTSAVLGSMLGIKPVLHVDDEGHLILKSKSRGRAASLQALCDRMKETGSLPAPDQMVFIGHGDCEEDAEKLAELLKKQLGVRQILIHTIGAVIGSHSGPGTIALFFLAHNRG